MRRKCDILITLEWNNYTFFSLVALWGLSWLWCFFPALFWDLCYPNTPSPTIQLTQHKTYLWVQSLMFQSRQEQCLPYYSNNCHPETIVNDHINTSAVFRCRSTLKVLPVISSSHLPTPILFPKSAVRVFQFSIPTFLSFCYTFKVFISKIPQV